ncbi:hypothetical protein RA29_20205 [Tateyamaria sp. ANG-S1]|nr:hypothetical protein RA29_20205 [Tateyamaria sp. ANG-S1]
MPGRETAKFPAETACFGTLETGLFRADFEKLRSFGAKLRVFGCVRKIGRLKGLTRYLMPQAIYRMDEFAEAL